MVDGVAHEDRVGSVCGVDGVVTDDGRPTQLAEPLIQVSRYVCLERRQRFDCSSESFSGTVRRSEMTVDPLLRRATIRGTLGGCALDLEFAGFGRVRPGGSLGEPWRVRPHAHDQCRREPQLHFPGSWWGGVCGETVAPMSRQQGQGWFRGAAAGLNGFGGAGGEGHSEG